MGVGIVVGGLLGAVVGQVAATDLVERRGCGPATLLKVGDPSVGVMVGVPCGAAIGMFSPVWMPATGAFFLGHAALEALR